MQSDCDLEDGEFFITPFFFNTATFLSVASFYSQTVLLNKVIITRTGFLSQSANFDLGNFYGYRFYSSELNR